MYTPVHGSWLNMAEIEISALVRQCLGKRRLSDIETLRREIGVWQEERNQLGASVEWRFTTLDACTKLRSLYPAEVGESTISGAGQRAFHRDSG